MKEESAELYNPAYIESLFDKMSNSYERINILFSFGFTHFWRKAMLAKIKKEGTEKSEIIDLMAGMGETWDLIKNQFPDSNLTGLDISEGMLSRARKKNKKDFNDSVLITKQNVLDNNLADNQYDIVLCAFGLKTFNEDQIKILARETHRILKPGGRVAFVEISSPSNSFFQWFFQLYLGKITPIITKVLLGDPEEYKMLWKYTSNFGNCERVADLFRACGLEVVYDEYFFGCASGIHGRKIVERFA